MLPLEIQYIGLHDYDDWNAFARAGHPCPWDEYAWFALDIGIEGKEAADLFYVLVSTPAAVSRAIENAPQRRFFIVESFEPEALAASLRNHVASINVHTWEEAVKRVVSAKLRTFDFRVSLGTGSPSVAAPLGEHGKLYAITSATVACSSCSCSLSRFISR